MKQNVDWAIRETEEHIYEVGDRLETAMEILRTAIKRVRDLHFATEPGELICEACAEEWPCATIRALNGESA